LMIEKGAKYWNVGLTSACLGRYGMFGFPRRLTSKKCDSNYFACIVLMIKFGANACNFCHRTIADHLKINA